MTLSVHAAKIQLNLLDLEFARIAAEGRESPVPIQAFVDHRTKYMRACEVLYEAMWMEIADTGVQIVRGDVGEKKVVKVQK